MFINVYISLPSSCVLNVCRSALASETGEIHNQMIMYIYLNSNCYEIDMFVSVSLDFGMLFSSNYNINLCKYTSSQNDFADTIGYTLRASMTLLSMKVV